MGTRCVTEVRDAGKTLVTMYRQHDGYPAHHGLMLAEWLAPIKIVDGLTGQGRGVANGPGCLAAQMVAHFKRGPGSIYLGPCSTSPDYVYLIDVHGTDVTVTVSDTSTLFKGDRTAFLAWCKEQE